MRYIVLLFCLFLIACPATNQPSSKASGDADGKTSLLSEKDKEDIIIQQSFNSWSW